MIKSYDDKVKKLGIRVKTLRKERNYTQVMLAAKVDIDVRTIQRIENGHHAASIKLIFMIADAFEISPGELFR